MVTYGDVCLGMQLVHRKCVQEEDISLRVDSPETSHRSISTSVYEDVSFGGEAADRCILTKPLPLLTSLVIRTSVYEDVLLGGEAADRCFQLLCIYRALVYLAVVYLPLVYA